MVCSEFVENIDDLEDNSFKITDLTTADWAIRKLKRLEEKRKAKRDFYTNQLDKLKLWLENEEKKIEEDEEYFKSLLRPWVEEEVKDSRVKSVSLPNGRVGIRTATTVEKNDALFDMWVRNNAPQYIKQVVTEKLDWANLKKACSTDDAGRFITSDGEIVEGVVQHKESKVVVSF